MPYLDAPNDEDSRSEQPYLHCSDTDLLRSTSDVQRRTRSQTRAQRSALPPKASDTSPISPDNLPMSGHNDLPKMSPPCDPPTGLPKATNPFGRPVPVSETSSERYERCLGLNGETCYFLVHCEKTGGVAVFRFFWFFDDFSLILCPCLARWTTRTVAREFRGHMRHIQVAGKEGHIDAR